MNRIAKFCASQWSGSKIGVLRFLKPEAVASAASPKGHHSSSLHSTSDIHPELEYHSTNQRSIIPPVCTAGPWGGSGGCWKTPHGSVSRCCVITSITICWNQYGIRNFSYCYRNGNNGCVTKCGPWGQTNPCGESWNQQTISIPCGEYITSIEGTYGCCQGCTVITSLTFRTNCCRTWTVGHVRGTKFCFRVPCGKIVGFCCRSGVYLDAISAYYA